MPLLAGYAHEASVTVVAECSLRDEPPRHAAVYTPVLP